MNVLINDNNITCVELDWYTARGTLVRTCPVVFDVNYRSGRICVQYNSLCRWVVHSLDELYFKYLCCEDGIVVKEPI
jgi:hypothetical protein